MLTPALLNTPSLSLPLRRYLLPHWAEQPPPGLPAPDPLSGGDAWTTQIWLPAAPRLLAQAAGAVSQAGSTQTLPQAAPVDPASNTGGRWLQLALELADEVGPHLLLFLRRVRRLSIHDVLRGRRHVLTRVDQAVPEDVALLGGPDAKSGSACVTQITWQVMDDKTGELFWWG